MRPHRRHCFTLAALLCAATGANAEQLTIYRCTDAQGRLSLRDTPCRAGETQQTRTMPRPQDPPPRADTAATTAAPPPPVPPAREPAPRYIVPARPMYECVTPDGNHYTSDTGEGNPRWVPLWTLDYPVWTPRTYYGGGVQARIDGKLGNDTRYQVRVGDRPPTGPEPGPGLGPAPVYGYPPGTWIRDACYMLPQQEVCARLRDRRYELGRRYNSALQSERHEIDAEQRMIDARLANDCGGT